MTAALTRHRKPPSQPKSKGHGQGRSASYQRSDLELPGPRCESSPTNQLLKGPTLKALASGGVRLNWRKLRFGEAGHTDASTNERALSVKLVTSRCAVIAKNRRPRQDSPGGKHRLHSLTLVFGEQTAQAWANAWLRQQRCRCLEYATFYEPSCATICDAVTGCASTSSSLCETVDARKVWN